MERNIQLIKIILTRLDMFLGTEVVCNKVTSFNIGQQIYSDHSAVIMQWICSKNLPRPFLWRLNNCSLEAKGVKEERAGKITGFFSDISRFSG